MSQHLSETEAMDSAAQPPRKPAPERPDVSDVHDDRLDDADRILSAAAGTALAVTGRLLRSNGALLVGLGAYLLGRGLFGRCPATRWFRSAWDTRTRRRDGETRRDRVHQSSVDSFPASDPPSWNH